MKDGKKLVSVEQQNHVLKKIPPPKENYKRKSYFLRYRQFLANRKRGQTSWRCKGCDSKPPLCVGECFEQFQSI